MFRHYDYDKSELAVPTHPLVRWDIDKLAKVLQKAAPVQHSEDKVAGGILHVDSCSLLRGNIVQKGEGSPTVKEELRGREGEGRGGEGRGGEGRGGEGRGGEGRGGEGRGGEGRGGEGRGGEGRGGEGRGGEGRGGEGRGGGRGITKHIGSQTSQSPGSPS